MGSGIQGLRRLEVRDENGVASALLIGYTEDHNVAIGIASQRGDSAIVVLVGDEALQAIRWITGAMHGEMP